MQGKLGILRSDNEYTQKQLFCETKIFDRKPEVKGGKLAGPKMTCQN